MSIFSWGKGEAGYEPTATQEKLQTHTESDPALKTVREPNYHQQKTAIVESLVDFA